MDLVRHVAARIRELRLAYAGGQGISQEALARAIGEAANTVSRWETEQYRPSLQDLDKLARFFGVPITEFLPPHDVPESDAIMALLRTARELDPADLEELRRYAEFRRMRSLYPAGQRPRRGRRPSASA